MRPRMSKGDYNIFAAKNPQRNKAIFDSDDLFSTKKLPKFKNKIVWYDGIKFHSEKECERYQQLKALEAAGHIQGLGLQTPFIIIASAIIHGKKNPARKYISDFTYTCNGVYIVEDVKSEITRNLPVYRLKRQLMKVIHNIEIAEI